MILILDNFKGINPHGEMIHKIVSEHTECEIKKVHIPTVVDTDDLYLFFNIIKSNVDKNDIVLIPWCKVSDSILDNIVSELGTICSVVTSAGNFNQDISFYSPTRANNVTVVGCLNKSLNKATHSNYGDQVKTWIIGTSYLVEEELQHGTSISAAIYSAFLANSILDPTLSIEDQIQKYHSKVKL